MTRCGTTAPAMKMPTQSVTVTLEPEHQLVLAYFCRSSSVEKLLEVLRLPTSKVGSTALLKYVAGRTVGELPPGDGRGIGPGFVDYLRRECDAPHLEGHAPGVLSQLERGFSIAEVLRGSLVPRNSVSMMARWRNSGAEKNGINYQTFRYRVLVQGQNDEVAARPGRKGAGGRLRDHRGESVKELYEKYSTGRGAVFALFAKRVLDGEHPALAVRSPTAVDRDYYAAISTNERHPVWVHLNYMRFVKGFRNPLVSAANRVTLPVYGSRIAKGEDWRDAARNLDMGLEEWRRMRADNPIIFEPFEGGGPIECTLTPDQISEYDEGAFQHKENLKRVDAKPPVLPQDETDPCDGEVPQGDIMPCDENPE